MQDQSSLDCALYVCMFMYLIIRNMPTIVENSRSPTTKFILTLEGVESSLKLTTRNLRNQLQKLFDRLGTVHKFIGSIKDPQRDHFSSNVLTRIQASNVTDLDYCSNITQSFSLGMQELVSKRNLFCNSTNKVRSKRTKFDLGGN